MGSLSVEFLVAINERNNRYRLPHLATENINKSGGQKKAGQVWLARLFSACC
jgi:hypothetical protein